MAGLDEMWLLERWLSILTISCLVVIPMYDVFLSSSSFCVMAVSALDVLRWIAIKFGFVQFPIIQYGV